ncbi:MAG: thiol peroxidase [Candidatus Sumerlaeia bacterium]|nr:thiol peroxidase [Candidatus Sumerlaeia bacterium]
MADRSGLVTFKGGPMTLTGSGAVASGDTCPDFVVSKSLAEDIKASDLKGKKVVLNVVPSLDTPVCSTQTARFNKEAAALGDGVVILTISADLPPAQARWCQANSAEAIVTASDYKHRDFGDKFGLKIKELGVLARAVYVVDASGKVVHSEIVSEIVNEPNYQAALDALKGLG